MIAAIHIDVFRESRLHFTGHKEAMNTPSMVVVGAVWKRTIIVILRCEFKRINQKSHLPILDSISGTDNTLVREALLH